MSELPEGWTVCPLSHVVDVLDSQRVPVNADERSRRNGNVPYYGATSQVGWIDDWLFDEELLLLGEDGAPFLDPSRAKAYIVDGKSWVNNHAHVLRAIPTITSNSYLKHYLNQVDFAAFVRGTTRLKLNQRAMNGIPVRLAPLPEQQRIVSAIEHLLLRVQACRERLETAQTILKRFRQAIFDAGCSGRLTSTWRAEQEDPGSVEQTLQRLLEKRTREARSERERDRIKEIFERQEARILKHLPESWTTASLAKLCKSFDYGTASKSHPTGDVPVLRMGNIQNGEIDWADLVFTSDPKEIDRYRLRPNTVLFNRTNSPELVGKTAIYRGERPATFAGYLIRITTYDELNPEYLNCCLNSTDAREFYTRVKSDAVSQSNINAQKLATYEIPLCPRDEQDEVAHRTRKLLTLADEVEGRQQQAKRNADYLTQTILAKAFRGELVQTEAALARRDNRNYEPPTLLLERAVKERPSPADKAPHRRERKESPKMKLSRDSVESTIRQFPHNTFSFEDLRKALASDYEPLKDLLFDLLDESQPIITQVFDPRASAIRFVRREK